jgi:sugar transferase (PEP-CTERM/EpsH1 system associated)
MTRTNLVKRPRLLFLAHLLPWPLEGGGQIKSYYTLRALASQYDITLLAFIRTEKEKESIAPLLPLCTGGVQTVLLQRSRVRDLSQAFLSLLQKQSFLITRDGNAAMNAEVATQLAQDYSVVHVDHLQMMQFVPAETPQVKVVLDNHNIEYRIPQRIAETSGNPIVRLYAGQEWKKLREFEVGAIRRADATLTVSEEDATGLREVAASCADRIFPVPIGVDIEYFGVADRKTPSKTLLSIGTMSWLPNVEAMLYFCAEILPKIREQIPSVRLNIVGAKPTATIRALGEKDASITVTGSVPDVRPYAEDCGAFIVPLRSGSGVRVKILNALSMGLPVVSTTVGAEGIAVESEKNILLADSPTDFANAVVRLLQYPEVGDELGKKGRELMEAQYSWEAVGEILLQVYRRYVLPATATSSAVPQMGEAA